VGYKGKTKIHKPGQEGKEIDRKKGERKDKKFFNLAGT
jgi:hypothetical protein